MIDAMRNAHTRDVDDAIGERYLMRVVGDENDAHSLNVGQSAEQAAHTLPSERVELRSRLVEDDVPGLHGKDAGDGDALLLAAGQGRGGTIRESSHADALERVQNATTDLVLIKPQIPGPECHLVKHHGRDELITRVLADPADKGTDPESLQLTDAGIVPIDGHASRVNKLRRAQYAPERGFTAAVLAHQRHDLRG